MYIGFCCDATCCCSKELIHTNRVLKRNLLKQFTGEISILILYIVLLLAPSAPTPPLHTSHQPENDICLMCDDCHRHNIIIIILIILSHHSEWNDVLSSWFNIILRVHSVWFCMIECSICVNLCCISIMSIFSPSNSFIISWHTEPKWCPISTFWLVTHISTTPLPSLRMKRVNLHMLFGVLLWKSTYKSIYILVYMPYKSKKWSETSFNGSAHSFYCCEHSESEYRKSHTPTRTHIYTHIYTRSCICWLLCLFLRNASPSSQP